MNVFPTSQEFLAFYKKILPYLSQDFIDSHRNKDSKMPTEAVKQKLQSEVSLNQVEIDFLIRAYEWGITGFGILEGLLLYKDFYEIVIKDRKLWIKYDDLAYLEQTSISYNSDRHVHLILAYVEVEIGVRINEFEPIIERIWRGFVIQAAVVPVTASPYIRIVNPTKLKELFPNTKLPN